MSKGRRSLLFDLWPRYAARRPWRVLIGALIAVVVFGVLFLSVGGGASDSFSLPGTESQRMRDLLKDRFPEASGDSATVVVRSDAGFDDPSTRSRVEALVAELEGLPEVLTVISPFDALGAISADGSIGRITVQYERGASEVRESSVDALVDLREERSEPDFQVEMGGQVIRVSEIGSPGGTELMGLGAAVIILLIAFGSVVAMGLPIVTALFALVSGFFLIGVGASFLDLMSFTTQFAAMIGIGVGIDYSLLVVTRYREALVRGLSVEEAIVEAAGTAGRTVVFAGSAVGVALLGLWLVGIPFVAYMGTAGALIVALSVLVAILVLPALLGVVGTRVDRWRIPGLSSMSAATEAGMGYRLGRLVQRAPLAFFVLSLGILLVLAIPVLSMRLGSSDAGNNPESLSSRRAYDLLSEGFGPGFNGPITVGVRIDEEAAEAAAEALPSVLQETDGVATVSQAIFNEERSAAVIVAVPETAPQEEETNELVDRLRRTLPTVVEGSGAEVLVGGPTAAFIDVGDRIASRIPYFFAAVIGVSFVLLMAVFRSVLVPLKAAAMNLLSIGAAYGVLVAIFQWGWFGGLVGVERTGPIESFLPMIMFAVLFGLSMDYEVFLLSRIQEEYLKTKDNSESVARGLSVTARVITAAAAIMVAVFLAFAFSDQRIVKEFGIGLAVAIFLDATVVRLILVPSLMQLLGDANWWFPRWLDRLLPRIGISETAKPAERVEEAAAGGGD